MVQTITKEWEITKTYIFDVASRDGIINLDWNDFESRARNMKVAVAVKVDEPSTVGELAQKAIEVVLDYMGNDLGSVIVAISFKPDDEMMMGEMESLCDSFSGLTEREIDVLWGIQSSNEIENKRCVSVFAFEKQQ